MSEKTHSAGQAAEKDIQLSGISELVFLDRYAIKDPTKDLQVGDTVVALVKDDPRFPQREVGTVKAIDGNAVTVEIKSSGETVVNNRAKVDKPLETHPSQMWDRMAKGIVEVEDESKRADLEKSFRWLLQNFRFSPGGRINAMLGTGQELTAYNCYVIPMESNDPSKGRDSRQAIIDTLGNMVEIMSRGGGVGINLSTLRPRLAHVTGVNGRSSGSVSWGGLFSFATGLVEQGGSRRGALMLILNDWHPDILDFITAKRDMSAITNANISVAVSNDFMKAVEEDLEWELVFPDTTDPDYDQLWDGNLKRWRDEYKKPVKVFKKIRARDMWDTIIESAWMSAEPGVVFLERMNEYSNSWYFEDLISTNPCVTGDTLVYTDRGMVRADQLWFNQEPICVASDARMSDQAFLQASEVFATGIKPVYRLKTKEGFELRLTADHRVLTEERGWVEAQHLKEGDRIRVLNRGGGFGQEGTLELGRVLGWLVGDGTIKSDRAVLSFFGSEKSQIAPLMSDAVNRVVRKAKNNREYPVSVVDVDSRDEARVPSARLLELAAEHKLLEDKLQVPDSVFQGSKQMQLGFLQAIFTADGHVEVGDNKSRGAVVLTSKSRRLLQDVQQLLLNFGIYSRLCNDGKTARVTGLPNGRGGAQDYFVSGHHDLRITSGSAVIFAEEIGFLTTEKQAKLSSLIDRYTKGPYKESFVATFSELVPDGEEMVYDLNVPGIHAFVANGLVVHNCGEQPLPGWGVCNLGHINLSRFVKDGEVAWDDLKEAVRLGVRFLDNVIDVTPYFFERNEKVQKDERRIGLGTLGLGEMLIRLGLRYGSDESVEFIDELYRVIATEAYLASIELAKEKGPFPLFDAEKFMQSKFVQGMPKEVQEGIKKHGIRNVCILTQAPTGSTGTMIGTSTGIEPYYSWTYWRKGRLGMKEVRESIVEEWFDAHPEAEGNMENLPDYFVTAMDLEPKDHIRVQAAVQRWTDSSISKTANCPNHYTIEQTKELYEYAFKLGCKGVTIYRDGSRDEQVLSRKEDDSKTEDKDAESSTEASSNNVSDGATNGSSGLMTIEAEAAEATTAIPASSGSERAQTQSAPAGASSPTGTESQRWDRRPQKLTGATYEWPTPLGKAFITVNELDGKPVEVFVNVGKAGSDVAAASEALGRLVTLFLKHAALEKTEKKVSMLVDHLSNIGGSTSVGFGENRVSSVPDAIAKTLRKHVQENGSGIKVKVAVKGGLDLCPTCGVAALAREEGCYVCKACGYTKC